MKKTVKVVHLTTVHPHYDVRIFHKQAKSLAQAGYDVTLIAQHDKNEVIDGVRIIALPRPRNRFVRIFGLAWRVFWLALRERADIYHFHDPELICVGILLRIQRKRVLYDVHEDVPRQILSKHWIPLRLRRPVSEVAGLAEKVAAWALNGIVAATPAIAARFPARKTVNVQNFPILGELAVSQPIPYDRRPPDLAYVGGIADIRGAKEMIQAMELLPGNLNARLFMAGSFSPPALEQELRSLPDWSQVEFLGWQSRSQVADLLGRVRAGLVVLRPVINYIDSYPVKLFEYMSAGIPIVASDFPLWREIVTGNGCGLVVNPLDPQAIAGAVLWLLRHPEEAEAMGKRGQQAVWERYNWAVEAKKLLAFYEKVLG